VTTSEAFTGFPPEALDFYEGLEADNTKAYWTEHRQVYEEAVKAPLLAFCHQVEPEFGVAKVFRPYRDVRFSRDKSPYKTAQGAVLGDGRGAGVYLQISAAGLFVAAGYHEMATDQMQRFREAVDDDTAGESLQTVLAAVEAAGHHVDGDRLKTRPRGYPEHHPRLELLRYRTLTASHQYPPEDWLHTPAAAGVVTGAWREMQPLTDWLARHVGPGRAPRQ
jgi:uncharacterized protein (TIGR02453 family)